MSASKSDCSERQTSQPIPSFSSPPDFSERTQHPQVIGTPPVQASPNLNNSNTATSWGSTGHHNHPYVQYTPVENPTSANPVDSVLHKLNSWGRKAESKASNIWQNLLTGKSVSEAAWGKMNLAAKAVSGGGFESLYKQQFTTFPNETLKKTFACYVSTTSGPLSGTLFLSNASVAFCSDQPISFASASSGLQSWSYYKVMIPLGNICGMNPVTRRENPPEKYIQLVTVDGHEFWFMGFVNYEKASHHIFESIYSNAAPGIPVQSAVTQ